MHRRIDVSGGGGTYTGDTDWEGTNTYPNAYPATAFSAGGVRFVVPIHGKIAIWCELRASQADAAAQATTGAFTWSGRVLQRTRSEGEDVIVPGQTFTGAVGKKRMIEDELVYGAECWVQITAATGLGAAGAIWVYVSREVK